MGLPKFYTKYIMLYMLLFRQYFVTQLDIIFVSSPNGWAFMSDKSVLGIRKVYLQKISKEKLYLKVNFLDFFFKIEGLRIFYFYEICYYCPSTLRERNSVLWLIHFTTVVLKASGLTSSTVQVYIHTACFIDLVEYFVFRKAFE